MKIVLFLQHFEGFMENFSEIKKTKIFAEISENDMQAMAYCLKIKFKNYNKNALIIEQGQPAEEVVILLKGGAKVENIDTFGDISLITKLKAGDVFGVENSFLGETQYKENLVATENCLVMFLNRHRLITPCENKCKRHDLVVKNLMRVIVERNKALMEKLKLLSKKNIREKVLAYLHNQSIKAGSSYFDLPYNKTELANYLSVDRSALSTTLSKLREEGLIDFDKKHYHINNKAFEKLQ